MTIFILFYNIINSDDNQPSIIKERCMKLSVLFQKFCEIQRLITENVASINAFTGISKDCLALMVASANIEVTILYFLRENETEFDIRRLMPNTREILEKLPCKEEPV